MVTTARRHAESIYSQNLFCKALQTVVERHPLFKQYSAPVSEEALSCGSQLPRIIGIDKIRYYRHHIMSRNLAAGWRWSLALDYA